MIPEANFQRARSQFLRALDAADITLLEIMDYFSVDGDNLDPTDPTNTFWIDWYHQTKKIMEPDFDVFHVYKIDAR